MAIQLKFDLKPVERKISDAFSAAQSMVSDFFTKENLELIGERAIDIGTRELLNFAESQLTQIVKEYISNYDYKLSSLIRKMNHIIPFPSFNDLIMGFTSSEKCTEDPFSQFDPYITGAFFVFIYFPDTIVKQSKKINLTNLCGFLAKGFTVPTLQIQTLERKGFGNTSTVLPNVKEFEKTITVTFYDTYNLVVQHIFEAWMNAIIDMRSGFHSYKDLSDFKGSMVLINYTPSMKKEVYVKPFYGIFPTSLPLVEQSRENIAIKEVQVTFAYDTI